VAQPSRESRLRELIWMVRHGRSKLQPARQRWSADLAAWRRFWSSYDEYRRMGPEDEVSLRSLFPRLGDDTAETDIEPTYFYQDAWAFEKIVENLPREHVDVGSHHKFVALLSKVVPTTMVDIRPLSLPLNTLVFRKGSILEMPYEDGSVESLSSLCVVEHIGLGRYGDPLDPKGTEKAVAELKRILAPNGNLYVSVPVDDVNRTYFNAHRAFTEPYLEELFAPLEIVERRYIYGNEFGTELKRGFGTGCYHLRRGTAV
jgi:SAM-dependent methyltransferase